MTFEFTKNYKFTILNNENVWAKAMNRVVNEKIPVDKAVDEMIARIKSDRRIKSMPAKVKQGRHTGMVVIARSAAHEAIHPSSVTAARWIASLRSQ